MRLKKVKMLAVSAVLVFLSAQAVAREGGPGVVEMSSYDGDEEKERAVAAAFERALVEKGALSAEGGSYRYQGTILFDGKRTRVRIVKLSATDREVARIVVTSDGQKVDMSSLRHAAAYLAGRVEAEPEPTVAARPALPPVDYTVDPSLRYNYDREVRRKRAGVILGAVVSPLLLVGTAVAVTLLMNKADSETCEEGGLMCLAGIEYAFSAVLVGIVGPSAAIALLIVGIVKATRGSRRIEEMDKARERWDRGQEASSAPKLSVGVNVGPDGSGGLSLSVAF